MGEFLPGWMVLTSEAIGPPIMPRRNCIWDVKTPTVLRTTTVGPIAMVGFRRARRCTIRSAGAATISARLRSIGRRALRPSRQRETFRSATYWRGHRNRTLEPLRTRERTRHLLALTSSLMFLWGARFSQGQCCTHSRATSASRRRIPAIPMPKFARNSTNEQAFVTNINGFNRPTNIRFGPDGCAYVVDYGAVRDNGSDTHFVGAGNGPLVQIPGTGVIYKICPE